MKRIVIVITTFSMMFIISSCKNDISRFSEVEIYNWYYSTKCINNKLELDGKLTERDSTERNFLLAAYKIGLDLNEDWNLLDQGIDLHKITDSEYQFEIITVFINQKNDDVVYIRTFYYDIESAFPIPIKEFTIQTINSKSKLKILKSLWEGDYTDYMNYYFNLNIEIPDSLK